MIQTRREEIKNGEYSAKDDLFNALVSASMKEESEAKGGNGGLTDDELVGWVCKTCLKLPLTCPTATPSSWRSRVMKRRAIPWHSPSPISLFTRKSKRGYLKNSRKSTRHRTCL